MSVKGTLSQLMEGKYIFLNYYPIKVRIRAIVNPGEAEATLLKKEEICKTKYALVIT